MNPSLREQFERLALRLNELDASLADPQVSADIRRYRALSREQSEASQVVGLYRRYQLRESDLAAAREEQFRSVRIIKLLASHGYMAAAKATMGFLGVDVGQPRLPTGSLSPEAVKTLRGQLETMGFFDWIR